MNDPILIAADSAINGPRNVAYGDAGTEFERIARIWSILIGTELDSTDVPRMLIAMKLVRSTVSPDHADHWVDIAGYAALAPRTIGMTR